MYFVGVMPLGSLPGLTRQSIFFARIFFAKMMDARVKPAHDDLEGLLTWRLWGRARG